MNNKILSGWQVNVELFEDYVIKTPKTEDEMKKEILKYLSFIGKIEELDKRTFAMQRDWARGIQIVFRKHLPKEMLGFPELLKDGKVKQKRAIILKEKLNNLAEKGQLNEMREVVDKIIDFIIELWKYGVHEKSGKIGNGFGFLDNKIILIDFGEICKNKTIAKKQIKKRYWEKKVFKNFKPAVEEYFNEQAIRKLTIKNLNKNWKIKSPFIIHKKN